MMRRMGLLLILGGVLLTIVAIPSSWAITGVGLDRMPNTVVASDTLGAITLTGFNNNKPPFRTANFDKAGTITNAWGGQTIALILTVDPNVTVSCKSYSGGKCTAGGWTLNLCLSVDPNMTGKTTCSGTGQSQQLNFSNATGPGNPAPQTFSSFTVAPSSTLHLYAKGSLTGASASAQFCAETMLNMSGTGQSSTLSLSHSSAIPRRFVLSAGSAYTCQ